MDLLYIGNKINKVCSGSDIANLANQHALEEYFSHITYIPIKEETICEKLFKGITSRVCKQIFKYLITGKYEIVFLSQSHLGRAARFIHHKFPKVKIITFCHNIEKHYAQEYFKSVGIKSIPFFISSYFGERLAMKHSDLVITLNERDKNKLLKEYNRIADAVIPISIKDNFNSENIVNNTIIKYDYLFVGSAFPPNIDGIQWFISHIMPKVPGKLLIIGKGMDKVQFKNITESITIKGYVSDLSKYYVQSHLVIMPIFSGGGMKTKTAEALMFGKPIIGTSEALEGYLIDDGAIALCENADQFIDAINIFKNSPSFNPKARTLFVQNYSYKATYTLYKSIFDKITNEQ